jgi:hypothetical protein
MKPSAGGHIEDAFDATLFEQPDEVITLTLGTRFPIDQVIPFAHKALDVFFFVVVGISLCNRVVFITLLDRHGDCPYLKVLIAATTSFYTLQNPDAGLHFIMVDVTSPE